MGIRYNLVINACFRSDISDVEEQALQHLALPHYKLQEPLTLIYPKWDDMWRYLQDNAGLFTSASANGVISSLQKAHYWSEHWELKFTASYLGDSDFYENYLPIACWLAVLAEQGLFGYWHETNYPPGKTHLIYATGGDFVDVEIDSPLK